MLKLLPTHMDSAALRTQKPSRLRTRTKTIRIRTKPRANTKSTDIPDKESLTHRLCPLLLAHKWDFEKLRVLRLGVQAPKADIGAEKFQLLSEPGSQSSITATTPCAVTEDSQRQIRQ